MVRLEMKNYNTIFAKKAATLLVLSLGNVYKLEYLTSGEVLSSAQRRMTELISLLILL